MHGARCLLLALSYFIALPGCTSIRSVMLERDPCSQQWRQERHLPGVPITLQVPTHLKVIVTEKHYLALSSENGVKSVRYVELPTAIRAVSTELIRTEKIFTVDFKRPAAGRMDMTLDMEQQYFDKIQHEVEDETIAEVSQLVGNLTKAGLFGTASSGRSDFDAAIREVESVVACQVFEIDDPAFENRVADFLACHINKAHDAWVQPPGVQQIRRLPLADQHAQVMPQDTLLCPGGAAGLPGAMTPACYPQ